MDQATFDAECRLLARPRLDLRRHQSGEVVGVWGGVGPLQPPVGNWEHWLTVSCDWLARNGFPLSGLLAVYENRAEGAFHEFAVVLGSRTEVVGWGGGTELAGTEEVSRPPEEALQMYGSPAMRESISSGLAGTPFANYSDQCPLYRKGILLSLGGWHIPWPEYDTYDQEAGRLVLWTFEGAEPWLEVWQRPSGQLEVIPRIS